MPGSTIIISSRDTKPGVSPRSTEAARNKSRGPCDPRSHFSHKNHKYPNYVCAVPSLNLAFYRTPYDQGGAMVH